MGSNLTKRHYAAGLTCDRRQWLIVHRPDLVEPPSPSVAYRMYVGQQVGALARRLFPGGHLVNVPSSDWELAVARTKEALRKHDVVFEAAIESGELVARCDVLVRQGDAWDIIEVKSSSRAKDEHIDDLAFQVVVLTGAGFTVSSAKVCHFDSSFVRGEEEPVPEELFAITDVTESVERQIETVKVQIGRALSTAAADSPPPVRFDLACTRPECLFLDFCHPDLEPGHLLELPGLRKKDSVKFSLEGVSRLKDIPDGVKLTDMQQRVVWSAKQGEPFVSEGLALALAPIKFPACFVDFEAISPAIPLFAGTKPHQSVPFQWSCHVLSSLDADPVHRDFLWRENSDPRAAFAQSLHEALHTCESIVYYSDYELTTLRSLSAAGVCLADELAAMFSPHGLGVDLLKIVKEHVYHPGFLGSFSIKKVLPALVPDVSYDGLSIQDGETAAVEFLRMTGPGPTEASKEQIATSLREYCRLDTLAMVFVYRALCRLAPWTIRF